MTYHDPLDFALEDHELLAEVGLTTELMIAAAASPRHLSQEGIDRVLGARRPA